ncbi:arylacetamide deacetylase-like 3 isoform X2 [Tupaia chinensis]|uniref:Arylacetamide deacetylase-like 3 n=2 Tax=Tupaia chinensis TaxID=246437 RepID=L9L0Z2_TUPCH|nr:arylacetamide deacetylase-like 3 isoform X2 [Tupaia chinensis]ELW68623.1 Arylacetamide deacetylase-like 3 [Tupaia chinensis]
MRLRVLHCLFQLIETWGYIFEKLRICSMCQFVRFIHDLKPLKKDPDVMFTDLRFGSIPVKLYWPKAPTCTPRPGIVFYHGGGGVIGSLKTHHAIFTRLCKESDSVVLAVGYRQLPMHGVSTIKRDCIVATIHFLRSLDTYGVDPDRVVVCGDSLGGTAAAMICERLMNTPNLPRIRAHILVYAVLQSLDFQLPSCQQNQNVPLLSSEFVFYCVCCLLDISPSWKNAIMKGAHLPAEVWAKYKKWLDPENIPERFKKSYRPVAHAPLNEDVYLETRSILNSTYSPLLIEDNIMSQYPEACIVSCEHDFFRDHSLLYKKRLEDLGVPVTWHHIEDGFHGALTTLDMGCFYFPCSTRILNAMTHFIKKL